MNDLINLKKIQFDFQNAKYITRQVKDKYFEEIRYTNKFIERYLKNKDVINSKVL